MRAFVSRVYRDEHGQDLIEYALLTALVAFASVAFFVSIRNAIRFVFPDWVHQNRTNFHRDVIWRPPDPTGP
jgi:Flp pilus assembly pilin Flp